VTVYVVVYDNPNRVISYAEAAFLSEESAEAYISEQEEHIHYTVDELTVNPGICYAD
jgi:hypothetical protein